MTAIMDGGPFYHRLCLPIAIVQLQLLKSQNYDNKYDYNCGYNSGGNFNQKYGGIPYWLRGI